MNKSWGKSTPNYGTWRPARLHDGHKITYATRNPTFSIQNTQVQLGVYDVTALNGSSYYSVLLFLGFLDEGSLLSNAQSIRHIHPSNVQTNDPSSDVSKYLAILYRCTP